MWVRVTPRDMWVIQTPYDDIPSTQGFTSHKHHPHIGVKLVNFHDNSLYRDSKNRGPQHLLCGWGWPHVICGPFRPHMMIFRQPRGLVAISTTHTYGSSYLIFVIIHYIGTLRTEAHNTYYVGEGDPTWYVGHSDPIWWYSVNLGV